MPEQTIYEYEPWVVERTGMGDLPAVFYAPERLPNDIGSVYDREDRVHRYESERDAWEAVEDDMANLAGHYKHLAHDAAIKLAEAKARAVKWKVDPPVKVS